MKQPLHLSSRALRVIIAAVIMIIANATTARAQEIGGGGGIELSPESTPLTLEATVACDITVSNPRSGMKYSVDGGKTMVLMTGTTTIDVAAEKTVQFYGKGTEITAYFASYDDYTHIDCSANCYIYGNIMSLVDEAGFGNNRELPAKDTFRELFFRNTHLISHSEKYLVLPATTLTECCYESMFYGCTSLTTAPDLPAKTLATNCYRAMFTDCRVLTEAPELPATTLAEWCYSDMFSGCTNLNYIKCLATDISANGCTSYMVF